MCRSRCGRYLTWWLIFYVGYSRAPISRCISRDVTRTEIEEKTWSKGKAKKRGTAGDGIADLGEMGFNPVDVAVFRECRCSTFFGRSYVVRSLRSLDDMNSEKVENEEDLSVICAQIQRVSNDTGAEGKKHITMTCLASFLLLSFNEMTDECCVLHRCFHNLKGFQERPTHEAIPIPR